MSSPYRTGGGVDRFVALATVALLATGGCSTCSDSGIAVDTPADAPPRRRLGEPPPKVHAYPPHAIRSDGVGPYLIDMQLHQVLRELPEGPHLELLQVGRYANWRVVRADGGDLVIGADGRNQVAFVAVLRAEVARTNAGVGVGATGAELEKALGPALERGDVVRDQRIFEFAALPGVRFVTDATFDAPAASAKVEAVVVAGASKAGSNRPALASCRSGGPLAALRTEVVAAARGKGPGGPEPTLRWACISASSPEAVLFAGGELVVVGGEPGKLRRVAALPVASADFIGPLDIDGDGKDELVWGTQRRSDSEHSVDIHVARWDAGRLVEVLADRPFVLSDQAAAAAGSTPMQIDLALEVSVATGGISVGGFYTARDGARLRELVPLTPVHLRLDWKRGPASGPSPDAEPRSATDVP